VEEVLAEEEVEVVAVDEDADVVEEGLVVASDKWFSINISSAS
jgi:hypothetical protein